ncbi:ATP-binding protein [Olsenella sp. YH-ols2223]|uniref:ATP-binding protein n=2 Tax=Olsenella absiana TaxID=3115222 RepID=A0ABU7R9Z9_9ACTN
MIPRSMEAQVLRMANWFPIVSVTGPRQSGKSTLAREVFSDYAYVNLENPQTRRQALSDPVGFIENRPRRLVVDEAQLAPELFSMIQVASDESNEPGQYVLAGSQNFLLLKQNTQSLAGRVGMLRLLPLSFIEARSARADLSPDAFMLRGGYPRLYDVDMPQDAYFSAYLRTYVERDVQGHLGVRGLSSYRTLLELCAQCTGSLLNISRLANAAGVSRESVSSWLSMLESSYVVFRLRPYHTNLRKRLTKTPKLYFYDTGLLCYLLRIRTLEQLLTSPYLGAVFENLVIEERMKAHLNAGEEPDLYFYRDDAKVEVDLVDLTDPEKGLLAEIKSSQTYRSGFSRHLHTVGDEIGIPNERRFVVERAEGDFEADGAQVRNIATWLEMA